MKTDSRYNPSTCFNTFPFPDTQGRNVIREIARLYHSERTRIRRTKDCGLSPLYHWFHDPNETGEDIQKLRDLHVEMDYAVAAAYDWNGLDLGHSFHETKQGVRFTITEAARHEVLDRLLKLNHERYADEVKQGLHDKKSKGKKAGTKRGRRSSKSSSVPALFDQSDVEDEPEEVLDDE